MNPFKIKKALILLSSIPKYIKLLWNLTKDKRVPIYLKTLVLGSLLYLFAPMDLHPDFIPVWGMIDDMAVMLLVIERFVSLCPREIVDEHLSAMEINLSDFDKDIKTVKEVANNTYLNIKDNVLKIIGNYFKK